MKTWARHSLAFLDSEKSGGIILLLCTFISLVVANSLFAEDYHYFLHSILFSKPIEFWINDGLMTFFFLQVGLEIEREIYVGELNDIRKSLLPVLAALGGMVVPAAIHFILNSGRISQSGYGIPMATDIAFSLGVLSMLGNRVPLSLKIFLTALAIIDDLGAILVIAAFYSTHFLILYLGLALAIFAFLILLNRMNVLTLWVYLLLGSVMWFCMHRSGIHATISGVLLAFAVPFRQGDKKSPSSILQHHLHKPVTYLVLPLFALANTAITVPSTFIDDPTSFNSLGVILGLTLGKPLGMLAGIGFTMSIFITLLAFKDPHLIDGSKIAVLAGSLLSGVAGLSVLQLTLKKK